MRGGCVLDTPTGTVVTREGHAERELFIVLSGGCALAYEVVWGRWLATLLGSGAVAASTGIVAIDSLVAAMEESLPDYRKQHAPLNEKALRAGYEFAEAGATPAWSA